MNYLCIHSSQNARNEACSPILFQPSRSVAKSRKPPVCVFTCFCVCVYVWMQSHCARYHRRYERKQNRITAMPSIERKPITKWTMCYDRLDPVIPYAFAGVTFFSLENPHRTKSMLRLIWQNHDRNKHHGKMLVDKIRNIKIYMYIKNGIRKYHVLPT